MIDHVKLLSDLRSEQKQLQDAIRERIDSTPEVRAHLEEEYSKARKAGRTAQSLTEWQEDQIVHAASHWILAAVFLRFIEDNGLIKQPLFTSPGEERRRLAEDSRAQYFQKHPKESDREYMESCFSDLGALPGLSGLYSRTHNPLWRLAPTADGAERLFRFFTRIDPETGNLAHDFTDPNLNTRFLGDLYQDLSDDAKKRYALLQTPEFIEEFILDRTLTPAIEEFPFKEIRLIDPACGSGHFLLGAFQRLLRLWQRAEPNMNIRELCQRALNQVYGVDLNPLASSIAVFRLLVGALRASEIEELRRAPDFKVNVATGDALLHGRRPGQQGARNEFLFSADDPIGFVYETEDGGELKRILQPDHYHVVVGNPPYITPRDQALNDAYRQSYFTCHRQYQLVVPFIERFF